MERRDVRIAVYGTGSSRNIGDSARLLAIAEQAGDLSVPSNVRVFGDDHAASFLPSEVMVDRSSLGSVRAFARTMRGTDILIYDAGLQDVSSRLYLPALLWRPLLARFLGVRISFYGIGVGPLNTRLGRSLARLAANRADALAVRDRESRAVLESIGASRVPIHVTADPAFRLREASPSRGRSLLAERGLDPGDDPLITVSPRRWFYCNSGWLPTHLAIRWGFWPPGGRERNARFASALASAADRLVKELGARVLFVPTSPGQAQDDDDVARTIHRSMQHGDRATVLEAMSDPLDIKDVLSVPALHIGARMHSTILAMSSGVPCVGLSYSPKFESLFSRLDLEDCVIPIGEVTEDRVWDLVLSAWNRRSELREKITSGVCTLRDEADRNRQILDALARPLRNS